MSKKMSIIAAISILLICLISNFSFATSGNGGVVGNAYDDATSAINDGGQMVGNAAADGARMVGNVVDDGADMVQNGMNDLEGGAMDGERDATQTVNEVGGDAKNATQTMTDQNVLSGGFMSGGQFLGINSSVWLWIIIIIIIIVVIVLICRYMQNHDNDNDNNDDE